MKKIIFILLLIPLIMVGQNFNFKKFDTTNIYDKIRFDSTILANRIYQDSLLLSDKVDSVWVDLADKKYTDAIKKIEDEEIKLLEKIKIIEPKK